MQSAVMQQEVKLQLLIRLTPFNRAVTSYILGAAGVSFKKFLFTCVAIVPNLCLEVYFGIAGKQLAKEAGSQGHVAVLHDIVMAVGLVIGIAVMVLISRAAKKSIEMATVT